MSKIQNYGTDIDATLFMFIRCIALLFNLHMRQREPFCCLLWIRWALSMFLLDLKRLYDMATAVNNKGPLDMTTSTIIKRIHEDILCHDNLLQIYRLYSPSILATMQLPLLFYNFIAIFFYFIHNALYLDIFIFVSVAQCSIFGPVNYISKWFIQLDSFMFSVGSLLFGSLILHYTMFLVLFLGFGGFRSLSFNNKIDTLFLLTIYLYMSYYLVCQSTYYMYYFVEFSNMF
ncbi:hypothetical protein ACJX0J_028814, partial [Zea mays]